MGRASEAGSLVLTEFPLVRAGRSIMGLQRTRRTGGEGEGSGGWARIPFSCPGRQAHSGQTGFVWLTNERGPIRIMNAPFALCKRTSRIDAGRNESSHHSTQVRVLASTLRAGLRIIVRWWTVDGRDGRWLRSVLSTTIEKERRNQSEGEPKGERAIVGEK